jgi:hypothetical protein
VWLHACTPVDSAAEKGVARIECEWCASMRSDCGLAPLVAHRRVALHRSLGVLGGVLATVMVVSGITAAVISGRRPAGFTGP